MKIPPGTPTDLVLAYREQGYDDETIMRGLQQQGYSSQQVNDAFNQANQKKQAVAGPVEGMEKYSSDNTEAIVESLVEEKWAEFQDKLKFINEWKERVDSQLMRFDQEIKLLKENFDKLHEGILGKISEYDTNLKDVGSSVKAMDEVFKRVIPSLTDSVGKLNRMANK
jgi:hypothetical protein